MPAPDWYHPIDYADITALRRVSLAARAVFLEAFGAELGSKTGLVEIRPNLIAAESEGVLTRLAVERTLEELAAAGLVVWSHPERMAYHLGHLIRHGATNPKHAAGWRSQLLAMPECSARDAAVSELDGIPYRKGIDRVSIGYRPGNQQEQEQEQEQEQNGNSTPLPTVAAPIGATAPSKERKKPEPKPAMATPTEAETLTAVVALVPTLAQHLQSNLALACHSYWQSAGWRRAGGPIKDWPATVRTWVARAAGTDRQVAVALAARKSGVSVSAQPSGAQSQQSLLADGKAPQDGPTSTGPQMPPGGWVGNEEVPDEIYYSEDYQRARSARKRRESAARTAAAT